MRDRLIELLRKDNCCIDYDCNKCLSNIHCYPKTVADLILADGWMRPPCKVGQALYVIAEMTKQIVQCTVIGFYSMGNRITIVSDIGMICNESIGRTVFTSREEAVKALNGGGQG